MDDVVDLTAKKTKHLTMPYVVVVAVGQQHYLGLGADSRYDLIGLVALGRHWLMMIRWMVVRSFSTLLRTSLLYVPFNHV